jgi:hypothetical protein
VKVFFADDIENMVSEMISQAVKSVRLHVIKKVDGHSLSLMIYVTALCNNQVFECVRTVHHDLEGIEPGSVAKFATRKAEEAREQFREEWLRGFEIKSGVYEPN